jgi:hypothetical protein
VRPARPLAALLAAGALAVASPAVASPSAPSAATACGSVSYTVPGSHGEGHAALNDLTASGVSCATARTVAKAFLADRKLPRGWRARPKTVVRHGETIGEQVFTHGSARVVGDLAN